MIGIAIVLIFWLIINSKNAIENSENKRTNKISDGFTYIDNRGRFRLISNNHIAIYTSFNQYCYGDYVLIDTETRNIIYNFTQQEKKENQNKLINEAKEKCKSTYQIYSTCEEDKKSKIKGKKYKDFETGDIYVIRCCGNRYYYMNIDTGLIIRETDGSKEKINKNKLEGSLFNIEEFNERQKNENDYVNYMYNGFCEYYY